MNIDLVLRITQLIISASVPIIILILGVKLTKKIENAKAESAKKHFWNNRLSDTFFDKFKTYTENFAEFIANVELLKTMIAKGNQSEEDGILLVSKINELANLIFIQGVELKIYANNLFGKDNDVTKALESLYSMLAKLMNTKQFPEVNIYEELEKLNSITRDVFNKTQK